jgi:hypothetical protein
LICFIKQNPTDKRNSNLQSLVNRNLSKYFTFDFVYNIRMFFEEVCNTLKLNLEETLLILQENKPCYNNNQAVKSVQINRTTNYEVKNELVTKPTCENQTLKRILENENSRETELGIKKKYKSTGDFNSTLYNNILPRKLVCPEIQKTFIAADDEPKLQAKNKIVKLDKQPVQELIQQKPELWDDDESKSFI